MDYLEKLQVLIEEGQSANFLSLWEEYCFNDVVRGRELVEILEKVKSSSLASLFGKIVDTVVPLWEKIPEGKDKDRVLQLILDLQTSNSQMFFDIATEYVNKKYSGEENFNEALRVVGLRDGRDFQFSLSRFDFLMHMHKGNFVFHQGGWGVGEVMGVSFLQQKVLIEFEGIMSAKDISFETAFKSLTPLSGDHFLSRRFGDPDGFEAFAKENPIEVVEILLRDLGPKTAKEIKDELVDLVIPEADWNRWWQSAKTKIKKGTRIISPDNPKEPYVLSDAGCSHMGQLERKLGLSLNSAEKISLIYHFIRDLHSELKNIEIRKSLVKALQDLDVEEGNKSLILQRELLLSEYLGIKDASIDKEYITSLSEDDTSRLLENMPIVALQKSFLSLVRKYSSFWQQVFMQILLYTTSPTMRDFVYKTIKNDPSSVEVLKKRLLDSAHQPMMFPELFVWFFLKLGNHEDGLFDPEDKEVLRLFLESALNFMYQVASTPHKELGKKLHHYLVGQRYLAVRQMIEGASLPFLKELLLLSTKCPQFSSSDLNVLQSLAEVVQPTLKKHKSNVEEENVLWSTSESFSRMKAKLQSLVGKEMVDNAKEIEDARSLGDLRENSEYKFALEKRARLQEEIRVLSEEINRARILTKDLVFTDKVGVGCKVTLKGDAGEVVEYTILGPWDADPDSCILSLQSKLAQNMLGKKLNDVVILQGKEYKISRIQSIWEEHGA
ncbi:GreA [Chlamydia pneumoniae TW-183]|uniref:Transcription elongation factor GreA n=4 Tax=Chlamydia pneumoniae TaxID=83558 RepID=GREA_CHLPN|nr:transcription elongation factor GreA [Chlamydia pneumoniae]Q9Z7G4.1 RecName: Full=Transcription elongation factor GreA; AltName: Full=Transcript cleavage factor GreA [Chlamydia pneumoniae]AAD18880.1 Transcription Elongation Factor [Chlamydia pneumoniae CWL029]AAF37901.1 transcription elongation protein, GreA/GreB family [Chlamydia pneumoniae AR39]AAP98698.1 GreA [Chlamydia pneumoniae TW-183]CRI33262.1 Transcription elongation factor GreA [Chlamydia pneumoniae]CRI36125.1 Transcription elong